MARSMNKEHHKVDSYERIWQTDNKYQEIYEFFFWESLLPHPLQMFYVFYMYTCTCILLLCTCENIGINTV